ncbi:hypothetical protein KR200_000336 [Drosophila serrata]|nr:hypothetical protein KR200_000336 [Drosophila serrata]
MWEKLVNCIKGGAGSRKKKGCQGVNLAELMKQVPPNQLKQFKIFAKKHEEYKERVRKYPESLPAIDWSYYRQNVRPEFVNWVRTYETKYDKLHSLFENRHAIVDHKRYFELVDKESEVVRQEILEYKAASNERIKEYQEQLEFLSSLKPYDQMTMEEFCCARPLLAPDFINKPTFWPHTPEEQIPGPSDPAAAAALHEDEPEPPEPPKKPPPSPQLEAKPAPEKPSVVADPQKPPGEMVEQASKLIKDLFEKATVLFYIVKEKMSVIAKDVQKKAEAAKAARAEAAAKSSDPDSTSSASSSQKTLDSFSERDSKPNICNQTIIRSGEDEGNPEIKARHTDLSIEADPCEAEDERIRQKARDLERRRQKEEQREWDEICRKVPDPCKPKDPCESVEKEPVCEAQPDPCELKEEEPICEAQPDPCKVKKDEHICGAQPDPCEVKEVAPVCDPCESMKEEAVCEPQPDPCESIKKEAVCEPQPDPCKPKEDESCTDEKEDSDPCKSKSKDTEDSGEPKETEQVYISISECSKEVHKKEQEQKKPGDKPKECASLTEKIEGKDQKLIMGQQVPEFKDQESDEKATMGGIVDVGHVYTDPNQIVQLLTQEKEDKEAREATKAKETKEAKEAKIQTTEETCIKDAVKPVDGKPVTIYPRRQISPKARTPGSKEPEKSPKELAKDVHSMAKGAASLLSEASNILEDLKNSKEVRIEVLEQAYINAQRQALGALAEASKAVNAANKLAKRSSEATGKVSSQDLEALVMAEKHAVMAKMLANRAVALKDEIARVLKDLKKKG